MRIDHDQAYAKRVWAGDQATVSEARAAYEKDPQEGLLPFAIALYSFRNNKQYAVELMDLRFKLLGRVREVMSRPRDQTWGTEKYRKEADLADVLSTHFEWMSRQGGIEVEKRRLLRGWAYRLCDRGIFYAGMHISDPGCRHSWCLLKLTKARLCSDDNDGEAARSELVSVTKEMQRIQDPNQRARVYRKLGFLLRSNWHLLSGFNWGIRACFVGGTPIMVRLKSVAALLGIDR